MLLRASISNTKKFFQKTLKSFKSFLSSDYQRLPKSPPSFNPFSTQSNDELDKFYTDFTDRWDSDNNKDNGKKRRKKKKKKKNNSNNKNKINSSPTRAKNEKEVFSGSLMKIAKSGSKENCEVLMMEDQEKKRLVHEGKRKEECLTSCSKGTKEVRSCLVVEKIKEVEMMDKSNIEHVLDIEEVLHYYSRLTCPAYVDIVDKFFMDMYAELSRLQTMTHGTPVQGR